MRHPFKSRLDHGTAPLNAIVLAGRAGHEARIALSLALTQAGYRVRLASTGNDLLREALGEGVDLILTDARLESAPGQSAIQALKRVHELKHIPVIAYSESGAIEDEARALDLGANAFLRNAANSAALLDTVASFLAARGLVEARLPNFVMPATRSAPA